AARNARAVVAGYRPTGAPSLSRRPPGWRRVSSLASRELPRRVSASRRGSRASPPVRTELPDHRCRSAHRRRGRRAREASRSRSGADERVRPRERTAGTLRAVTETARGWAERLGAVGIWTHDVERMSAAGASDYVRAIESLGFRAVWIQESTS